MHYSATPFVRACTKLVNPTSLKGCMKYYGGVAAKL